METPWLKALLAARVGCHDSVVAYRRSCERFLDLRGIEWSIPPGPHLWLPAPQAAIRFDNAKSTPRSIACLQAASAPVKILLLLNGHSAQYQYEEIWVVPTRTSPKPRREHR